MYKWGNKVKHRRRGMGPSRISLLPRFQATKKNAMGRVVTASIESVEGGVVMDNDVIISYKAMRPKQGNKVKIGAWDTITKIGQKGTRKEQK